MLLRRPTGRAPFRRLSAVSISASPVLLSKPNPRCWASVWFFAYCGDVIVFIAIVTLIVKLIRRCRCKSK